MIYPNFNFEKNLWNKGLQFVAGCDEVGRGCFAGPVVGASVVFSADIQNSIFHIPARINDSKKLNSKQRESADIWIRKNALAFGIGEASVAEINRVGIVNATRMAMRRAIVDTKSKIDHLLIDAFYLPSIKGLNTKKQTPIVKGDSISFSIAAASIVAKVYRDNLMSNLSQKYMLEKYGWEANKGYGTNDHRNAIIKYGVTKHHRTQFVSTFLSKTYHLSLETNH